MRIRVMGGVGDELMTTGLVREIRQARPDELIRMWRTSHPSLWDGNPRLNHGKTDTGRLHIICGVGPDEGSFWDRNEKNVGIKVINNRPELYINRDELDVADSLNIRRPSVAVDIYSGWAAKRWPIERYKQATRMLQRRGWQVIEIGSHGEAGLKGIADISLVNKLSIKETAAVLTRCTALLGNDSAGMHLAAAVRIPHVIIFSHTRDYGIHYDDTIKITPESQCEKDCGSLGCGREYRRTSKRCLWEIKPTQAVVHLEKIAC